MDNSEASNIALWHEMTFTGHLVNSTWSMLGLQGMKWVTLV